MRRLRLVHLFFAFCTGACASAAVQSAAVSPPVEAQPPAAFDAWMPPLSPVVVKGDIAELRTSPKGGATVTILARGHNAFLARLQMPAAGAVPQHRDTTEEYIHVVSGGGTITIDGTDHTLVPGDTVYMPANAEVSYQNGDEPLVAIQVFAGPEPAAKYGAWTAQPR
ncbi:MAG: cupin domain-containing protein [Myxococcota bacterium]